MAGSSNPETQLFIRLYLDEDIDTRLASALRLRQFDVISAHSVSHQTPDKGRTRLA